MQGIITEISDSAIVVKNITIPVKDIQEIRDPSFPVILAGSAILNSVAIGLLVATLFENNPYIAQLEVGYCCMVSVFGIPSLIIAIFSETLHPRFDFKKKATLQVESQPTKKK